MSRAKRILILSDLHCGHLAGLTPPEWWITDDPDAGLRYALWQAQRELWAWYCDTLASLRPFHAVFCLGDNIDGRGEKSGSLELIELDRAKQCEMALRCIRETRCKAGTMMLGTGYHTGDYEQWERLIAKDLGWPIGAHDWPRVNGVTFDLKHHLGASQVPYGRHTASSRDHLQNILWARDGAQPDADVILRGHVHYHQYCGGHEGNPPKKWAAITCPALQLANTRFGGLRMSGRVHVGLLTFDITDSGSWTWDARIAPLRHNVAEAREM